MIFVKNKLYFGSGEIITYQLLNRLIFIKKR